LASKNASVGGARKTTPSRSLALSWASRDALTAPERRHRPPGARASARGLWRCPPLAGLAQAIDVADEVAPVVEHRDLDVAALGGLDGEVRLVRKGGAGLEGGEHAVGCVVLGSVGGAVGAVAVG